LKYILWFKLPIVSDSHKILLGKTCVQAISGFMAATNHEKSKLKSALLCATGASDDLGDVAAGLLDMGGEPLIAHQISQLLSNGIEHFFIEVEELPGALVAMTERLRHGGVTITYVRSPQELAGILNEGELLLVMCDGIVADNGLLKEMISSSSRYIVTLDGREENSQYERIDLNSFWAGIALLDGKSVSAIASLPEGWSIRSSLLRQALQDSVPHRPLNQNLVLAKQLRRIKTNQEAEALGKEVLGKNARNVSGFVESKIFAPIIATIAPMLWKSPVAARALQFALPLLSVSSLAAALAGLAPIAAAIALISMIGFQLKNILKHNVNGNLMSKTMFGGMWAILGTAFIFMAWKGAAQPYAVIFPPLVSCGLLLIARKLPLKGWRKGILSSPAMLAVAALLFSLIDQLAIGIQIFAIIQIIILIFPLYFHDKA
jgi:hypothetical protein